MENLKAMLDKMSIADIDDNISKFIGSANGYPDKLKFTFVLLNLIRDEFELLRSVDVNDFIKQIKYRIDEIENEKETLFCEYYTHLEQNKEIMDILVCKNNKQINEIQHNIRELFSAYDGIIKHLVEARDKLPIEKQIVQEKK